MSTIEEKIEASLMLSSYLETLGFKNGQWEFNYNSSKLDDINKNNKIWVSLTHHFIVLGGVNNINITNWKSSDDTILTMAICHAVINGGGITNYIQSYLKYYDLLFEDIRASGINTKKSLKFLLKLIII